MANPFSREPCAVLCGLIDPLYSTPEVDEIDPLEPLPVSETGKRKMTPAARGITVKESRQCLTAIRTTQENVTPDTVIFDDPEAGQIRAGPFAVVYVRGHQRKRVEKKKRALMETK